MAGLAALAPPVGPPPPVAATAALTVAKDALRSGLTILVRENSHRPGGGNIGAWGRMGALMEPPATAGISNFVQLMLVRGTTHPLRHQIVEEADRPRRQHRRLRRLRLRRGRGHRALPQLEADARAGGRRRPAPLPCPTQRFTRLQNFLLLQIRNAQGPALRRRPRCSLRGPVRHSPLRLGPHSAAARSIEELDRAALLDHYRRYYRGGEPPAQ